MKQLLYFIPAIISCLFYGFALSVGEVAVGAYIFVLYLFYQV